MFNYKPLDAKDLEYVSIAPASELPAGERLFVDVAGKAIVILNIAGNLYAIGDVCTHDDGPLGDGDLEGDEIACPRHGARFDVRTGKVTALPAVLDIPAYPVRVRDGQIEIGLPKN
jgi:3-phenylpropionate/trans-cinnamate dioxygenase ferredoxin subunit